MSLANLARRFRRSHSKGSSSSSGNHGDGSPHSSSRSGSLPPTTSGDDVLSRESPAQTRMEMPTPTFMPSSPPLSMPEPATQAPATPAASPMNGALTDLAPLYSQLGAGPHVSKREKAMDAMGSKVDGLANKASDVVSAFTDNVAPALAALEKTDFAQAIERGIQHFTDDIPWLMKGLDELARIHPAVTVAVLAFKAVYALETTRQENDRRVMTLYVEMKDMMMVMVQLKGIENRTHIGLDGLVLKDRLEELAEKTAKNIKDCANVCDTFLKKRLLVKVLKGFAWAEKLAAFVKTFTERKADFQFALAMHTANSITDVKKQNVEIDAKLDVVVSLFDRFLTAEERRLADEVEREGGATKVRQSEKSLKALMALDVTLRSAPADKEVAPALAVREKASGKQRDGPGAGARDALSAPKDGVARGKDGVKEASITVDDLKWELREDIEEALERNYGTFIGKFELQVSLLQVALEKYIRTENDRVIGAVKEAVAQGPHMKIRHPELRRIWQDMNWRGNVKARLFIMTLRDHYRDVIEDAQHGSGKEEIINDDWTLEYFGPSWLQPMMDAFDDDASGYVTIVEVNKVMDLQPTSLGWSVPRWLAYWAVGWGLAAAKYATAIEQTLGRMRGALPHILPLNRAAVDSYLDTTWGPSLVLTCGVDTYIDPQLLERFQAYLDSEEEHLRSNLERVKYHIDASDTLSLVLGPRKLEKCILPLLYLLMQNHLRKIKAAQQVVLAEHELDNARATMDVIFSAASNRHIELRDLFIEQKLDPDAHFKKYARGLFANYTVENFWSVENMFTFSQRPPIEEDPDGPDISGIERDLEGVVDTSLYDAEDPETEADLSAPMPVKAVLGLWNGFPWGEFDAYPPRPMLSLQFHYSDSDGEDFKGTGVEFDGDRFTVSGTCETDDSGVISMRFSITYGDLIVHYAARLVDEFTLQGWRGYEPDQLDDWQFILKKVPAEQMCYRPSPETLLTGNRSRELWQYAISATLHNIRRKNWSWSYFAERRDTRKRYVQVFSEFHGRYRPELDEERRLTRLRCTAKDVRFYDSLAERFNRTFPFHRGRWCDNIDCSGLIGGARMICIDCVALDSHFYERLHFCDEPECYNATLQDWPGLAQDHYPTHDFLKVRTIVHAPAMADLLLQAQNAVYHCRDEYGARPPDPPGHAETAEGEAGDATGGIDEGSHDEDAEQASQTSQTGQQESLPDGDAPAADQPTPEQDDGYQSPAPPEGPSEQNQGDAVDPSATKAQMSENLSVGAIPTVSPDATENADITTSPSETDHDSTPPSPHPSDPNGIPPEVLLPSSETPGVVEDSVPNPDDDNPAPQEFKCRVCKEDVFMGKCWFCLECWDHVCNDCESGMLIRCHECARPFPQAEWYGGTQASDFICVMCSAKGVKERPDVFSGPEKSHVGTHPIVQCKNRLPDPIREVPEDVEPSTERRLASLEERMAAMDTKLERMQEHLMQLEKTQTDMQQVILSRLDETLMKVIGRVMNGAAHADTDSGPTS